MVAEDHLLVRDGICLLINAQHDMEVVAHASNGEEAWRIARECKPDILVMDISMPGLSGAQATERLHSSCPDIKILVVSAHSDDAHVRQMLTLGARGYVLKRTASKELASALRAVAQGKIHIDPAIDASIVDGEIKVHNSDNAVELLSERDLEILKLVARGHTNKELASRMHLSVKTIEGYKAKINAKLGLSSRAEMVEYALKRGWLHEE